MKKRDLAKRWIMSFRNGVKNLYMAELQTMRILRCAQKDSLEKFGKGLET